MAPAGLHAGFDAGDYQDSGTARRTPPDLKPTEGSHLRGAKVYADLCSIATTARLAGRSALAAIRDALAAQSTAQTAA